MSAVQGTDDTHRGHDHSRTFQADHDDALTYYRVLEVAVRELLIEKGILSAADIQRQIEHMDSLGVAQGARVVARAWVDSAFRARLLADALAAVAELGIDYGDVNVLVAVENTATVHNVVVCTLCSCYPRPLLGFPPAWYKSREYRSRVANEPRQVLAEFGMVLGDGIALRVHDSTADLRYIVLPMRPAGTDGWSEERLATLVTRDSLIGVARALAAGHA